MKSSPQPTVWLRTYEEVREAFSHPSLQQSSYDGAKTTIFADVLITLDGRPHVDRRRIEMPLFRPEVLADFQRLLINDVARLTGKMHDQTEADLVELSRRISTAMAAKVVGLDDCESVERLDHLARLMAKLHEGVTIEWSLRPREQVLSEVAVARDAYRDAFFGPSLERRRAIVATSADDGPRKQGGDLIETLLRTTGSDLGPDGILRETIHYLVAGAHTTATVLVQGLHSIWAWVERNPNVRLDDDVVQRCLHETLRLWPPSGWQFRAASEQGALKSGRSFAKGERIGLNLIDANRDPGVFGSDAEVFDPDRLLPRHVPRYGLAFGSGPHVCLGQRMAAGTGQLDGALLEIARVLLAAGCRPHPHKAPTLQTGTERHQYSSYPVVFRT